MSFELSPRDRLARGKVSPKIDSDDLHLPRLVILQHFRALGIAVYHRGGAEMT